MDDTFSSASVPSFSTPDFTAVLLAGGKSTRMGQDKAGLLIGDVPLWQRQLATLQASGASEILISGCRDGPYAKSDFRIVEDIDPDLGPLGGLVAAFKSAKHELVAVLAIDLPRMNAAFLRSLLSKAPVVPRRENRFEPLAAFYSKRTLAVFQRRLHERELSMQRAIRELAERHEITLYDVSGPEALLFENLNTPEDLAHFVENRDN